MPNEIRNLSVGRVSWVDRASVRDPDDPTQPHRYLLVKSATQPGKDKSMAAAITDSTDASTNDELTADEQQALEACLILLARCEHPKAALVHSTVRGIVHPNPEAAALKKMAAKTAELRKSDSMLTDFAAKERVRRENPRLMRELGAALRGERAA